MYLKITLQKSNDYGAYFVIFDEWKFSLDERSVHSDKRKTRIQEKAVFPVSSSRLPPGLPTKKDTNQYD